MKKILFPILVLALAAGCVGCCGAQGVPKANLYWPITFGYDAVTPTTQQTVTVPMAPTMQYVPQTVSPASAPYSAPAAAASACP